MEGRRCGPPGGELRAVRTAASIAPEAARRLDRDNLVEIEIDDRLQGFAGGGVAPRFGQRRTSRA
jgi:hypothetical protein